MKILMFLMAFALVLLPEAVLAQNDLDPTVKIASDTATQICGDIPNSGWHANASAAANLQIPIAKFLKKMINADASGGVKADVAAYAGPLQEQIAEARKDTQQCKVQVVTILLQYAMNIKKMEKSSGDSSINRDNKTSADVKYPKQTADKFVLQWLKLIDAGNYDSAYQYLDPTIKAMQSEDWFKNYGHENLSRCYPVKSRSESASAFLPANETKLGRDTYQVKFRTMFLNMNSEPSDDNEIVVAALSRGAWKIVELSPCPDAVDEVVPVMPSQG